MLGAQWSKATGLIEDNGTPLKSLWHGGLGLYLLSWISLPGLTNIPKSEQMMYILIFGFAVICSHLRPLGGFPRAGVLLGSRLVATKCFLQPGFIWDDVWFGTDGSGGVHSKDPRLRKCAWAVVAIKQHLAAVFDVVGGVCGLLVDSVGPNTVGQGWVNCVC